MKLFAILKPGTARFVLSWGLVYTDAEDEPPYECPKCGYDWGHGYKYFGIWLRHYKRRTYSIRGPKRKAVCE